MKITIKNLMNPAISASQYLLWIEAKGKLEANFERFSKELKKVSGGGAFGLTPDAVKATSAYQLAEANCTKAFSDLRDFNSKSPKRFMKKRVHEARTARLKEGK